MIPSEQIFSVYSKCLRVIYSCNTVAHMFAARRYINLFKKSIPENYYYLHSRLIKQYDKKLDILKKR